MKKILLGTTAMVAVSLAAGQAAAADPIAMSLGGYYRVAFLGIFNETNAMGDAGATNFSGLNGAKGYNRQSTGLSTDGEVHFDGSTTLDNGIGVAVRVELEVADANSNAADLDLIDEHYITLSGGFGSLSLGNNDVIAESYSTTAPVGASLFGVNSPTFVASNFGKSVVGTTAIGSNSTVVTLGSDATGARYQTPNFGGFQLGLSYQADGGTESSNGKDGTELKSGLGSVYGAGVAYAQSFGDINVNWSAGAAYASYDVAADATELNSLFAAPWEWQSGLNIGFFGFTVGGSYKHSDNVSGRRGNKNDVWDAGVNYNTGPVTVGMTMSRGVYNRGGPGETAGGIRTGFGGTKDAGTYTAVQLGASYALGAGLQLQGAVTWDNWDSRQALFVNPTIDTDTLANDDYNAWSGGLALGLSF